MIPRNLECDVKIHRLPLLPPFADKMPTFEERSALLGTLEGSLCIRDVGNWVVATDFPQRMSLLCVL